MKNFNFHQSTNILFGRGRINELGDAALQYGKRALLVTTPATIPSLHVQYEKVKKILKASGIEVAHYDGVIPNPTIETITAGAEMARKFHLS